MYSTVTCCREVSFKNFRMFENVVKIVCDMLLVMLYGREWAQNSQPKLHVTKTTGIC